MNGAKKINFKALSIRTLLSLFATTISSLGIGCYYGCGLGTDPISVFVDGLHNITGMSYGTISTICNVIQTALIFIFIRKYLGIGTLIGMFIGGPLIDISEALIRVNFPLESTGLPVRIIILLVGLLTTGIGYGLGIASKMGIGCFQFIPLFLSEKTPLDLKYTQMISDGAFFIIGVILGGVIGIGTIVGVFLTGYILEYTLSLCEKRIDELGPIVQENG
ncbi:MAG: hypothetical protein IJI92_02815 [Erysipelotrichaceae bacterium]|nr:hypothetical protein [Erysipelotrichaceae bacterium]